MTEKKVPKIRIVKLNEKSPSKKVGSHAANCEGDSTLRSACSCNCGQTPCPCQCECDCDQTPCPCQCECDCDQTPVPQCPSDCDQTTNDSAAYEKKQQPPKKSKGGTRTFFKMASEKNYYPLLPGLIREYRLKNLEGEKTVKIEVLSVSQEGDIVQGQCKRTVNDPNGEKVTNFKVIVRSDGIFVDGVTQFPLPLEIGRKWDMYPDGYKIASLTGATTTPTGQFTDCLRITCLIAGGEAGSGESFYAPGIGLVHESRSEEGDDSYELELISYKIPCIL